MNIGENIKKVRKLKGMSQKELSDLSGVPRVSISRYENNDRTPSINVVKKISEALSIKLEILVNWTDILNTDPDVLDFLENIFSPFELIPRLSYLLKLNQYNKNFNSFLDYNNFSDKEFFIQTANILELTDIQLYNWILFAHIQNDFYSHKEHYIRKYNTNIDYEMLDYDTINYIITSNCANLEKQSFNDLFFNGINNENKTKIKNYLEKIYTSNTENLNITEFYKRYGDDWRDVVINIESNPKFLLNSIIKYLEEKNNFFSMFSIDLYNNKSDDDIKYLTDNQINSIVKKVTDLVEYELYKIEKNNC